MNINMNDKLLSIGDLLGVAYAWLLSSDLSC